MARFILESDYDMQIKNEILRLLTATDFYNSAKLVRAENTAIRQIRHRIGKRYNCDLIFAAKLVGEPDTRDEFIVTTTIDLALYHLYSQTGNKDIPQHRQDRYQDALDWIKDVGKGLETPDLPSITDDNGDQYSEVRINSRPQENQRW